ncbi:alpha/beta hydrolase [Flaviaesturariibacter amylovorans]|uniref:Alpha/beta hydrolase-fold protein n=1 Tax=Flaviaesturariibacter amylovorans TaxID=1084520 RepID=A0ABP8H8P3_9BACT
MRAHCRPISLLVAICFLSGSGYAQHTVTETFTSKLVGDSFRLHITAPRATDSLWGTVYYLDAGIRSGAALRSLLPSLGTAWTRHVLFVGIAHTGDFHVLRRRDFIPPGFAERDAPKHSPDFGQAHRFHAFLAKELLPYIGKRYRVRSRRTLIGHSFGGLFALYALFRPERLFDQYIAMGPSIWANHWDLLRYEAQAATAKEGFRNYLYFSAGSLEAFNLVLQGTRRLQSLLRQRSYPGLQWRYEEHAGKGHNDAVLPALRTYFRQRPWP